MVCKWNDLLVHVAFYEKSIVLGLSFLIEMWVQWLISLSWQLILFPITSLLAQPRKTALSGRYTYQMWWADCRVSLITTIDIQLFHSSLKKASRFKVLAQAELLIRLVWTFANFNCPPFFPCLASSKLSGLIGMVLQHPKLTLVSCIKIILLQSMSFWLTNCRFRMDLTPALR